MQKKFLRNGILLAMCMLMLTACAQKKTNDASSDELPGSSSLPTSQNDKPVPQPSESDELSVVDAQKLLAETIDTEKYAILDSNTTLKVDGESYYTFIVAARENNEAIGQIAVNKKTGEKYSYTGGDQLNDYATFPLYDPAVEADLDWEGMFTDGTRSLELLVMDSHSFEYILGDDGGVAQISGNTAKDEAAGVTFTYDGKTLELSGTVTGTFTPVE